MDPFKFSQHPPALQNAQSGTPVLFWLLAKASAHSNAQGRPVHEAQNPAQLFASKNRMQILVLCTVDGPPLGVAARLRLRR